MFGNTLQQFTINVLTTHYVCHLTLLQLNFHIYEKKKRIFTHYARMAFAEIHYLVFQLYLRSIM